MTTESTGLPSAQPSVLPPVQEASPEAETVAHTPARKAKIPDWKPLGSVRDYFNEQIKQDQRW